MPWSTRLVGEIPIVETIYAGELSKTDLLAAVRATLRVAEEQGTRYFLADCRGLSGGHSVFDLYAVGEEVVEQKPHLTLVEAVLLPVLPGPAEMVSFWETLGVNRGLRIDLFVDRHEAIAWLENEQRRSAERETRSA